MIHLTRLAGPEALAALAGEWSALVDRTPDATPFQRPEWLLPWWRQFGSGEMHALAFRSGQRLVGLLGMFIYEWSGAWQVTLIGTGITDYLDLIAEPGAAVECARLAFDYLLEQGQSWDLCDWQDLSSGSALIDCAPPLLSPSIAASMPCTRTELPEHAAEYEASLPHGLRRSIRVAARRMERQGELKFETIRDDPSAAVLQQLFRLHESRWATKGGPESTLDLPATQQFFVAATQGFSAAGKLRLYCVWYRGELAAIICAIADQGRAWGYITGMDPGLSRFSPGSLVLLYAMGESIGEGASAWEFLRGDEQYKDLWGAGTVPKCRLRLYSAPGTRA